MLRFTGQVLRVVLMLPNGFIPSVLSANLIFLGSFPKGSSPSKGRNLSMTLHCGESAGCLSIPSWTRFSACQRISCAVSGFENKRFTRGPMGRYQHTFHGMFPFLFFVFFFFYLFFLFFLFLLLFFSGSVSVSSSLPSSSRSFRGLNLGCLHTVHSVKSLLASPRNNIQSFLQA